ALRDKRPILFTSLGSTHHIGTRTLCRSSAQLHRRLYADSRWDTRLVPNNFVAGGTRMTIHQLPLSPTNFPSHMRGLHANIDNELHSHIIEEMQIVTHLLSLGQTLCGQMPSGITILCNEVNFITQERAQLCLSRQRTLKKGHFPPSTLITLPVQFSNIVYGTLCITFDPVHTEQPSVPLPIALLLAQACSWLLYTLEQSSFLQGQCQKLDY